jgi:uncharacterized protein with von Willebrand factor type A (vWA) domain
MFIDFFYILKQVGIPVSPTSFLRLQKALSLGVINSLTDFYTGARSILVKSERYFDLYDQAFAHYFEGAELAEPDEFVLSEVARAMLQEWLKDPEGLAEAGVLPGTAKRTDRGAPWWEQVDRHRGYIPGGTFRFSSGRNAGRRRGQKQVGGQSGYGQEV